MVLDPASVALAFGEHLIFGDKLVGGILEGFFAEQLAAPALVLQAEIPVLRPFLGPGQAVFLGADRQFLPLR